MLPGDIGPSDLLDAAPDAILVLDHDGTMVLVSRQTEELFGYPREALLGACVDMLLPEDDHAAAADCRRTGPHADSGTGMPLTARRADGSTFPAEFSFSSVTTGTGPLTTMAIRDVTELRAAATAQQQLASIVQFSHEAIMRLTPDGVITSWNPAAERLYGHPATEVVGGPLDVLIAPARVAAERAMVRHVAGGGQVDETSVERVRRDGATITVSLAMAPITDPDGTVIGVAATSRDIGHRLLAETKFQGLLEAAPDAILGCTPDGRICLVNAQAERAFGYSRDELLDERIELLVPERFRHTHPTRRMVYFAHPVRRPMGAGMRLSGRRKDGSEFAAEISLSGMETEEGPIVLAAIRDVTERLEMEAARERLKEQADRERLEAQLHRSQRLESLGQLAGGVAHDFNNLLAVMLNYTALVAEQIADAADAEPGGAWAQANNDIGQVMRAGERATELTHQLLAFGRREVVRPQPLDLSTVVGEVEQLLLRTLGEHVQLHIRVSPGTWPVMADPGQLEQILVNLAVNARDAMPGGGTLSVDTANREPDASPGGSALPPGRYVEVRVADTGTGIAPDIVERIFEPFYTTKPAGQGTGLGLATVYGIVTQAGGDIAVSSVLGAGTAFTILLPATDEPVVAPASSSGVPLRLGGETVLLVEDEPALREVTSRLLARNGYTVITAPGGPEALKIVEHGRQRIDLLLTDVIMPHMLGTELAAELTAAHPGVRVLYMSGYAQPALAGHGTLAPGMTLVQKPFSEGELLRHMRDVLDR